MGWEEAGVKRQRGLYVLAFRTLEKVYFVYFGGEQNNALPL